MAPLLLLQHNHKTIFYCTIVHCQTQKVRAEKSSSLLVITEQMVATMAILNIKSLLAILNITSSPCWPSSTSHQVHGPSCPESWLAALQSHWWRSLFLKAQSARGRCHARKARRSHVIVKERHGGGAGTTQHSVGAAPARNVHDGGDDPNANMHDDEVRWRTKDGPMNDVSGGRATAVVEFQCRTMRRWRRRT
jgi:hypothetical protein